MKSPGHPILNLFSKLPKKLLAESPLPQLASSASSLPSVSQVTCVCGLYHPHNILLTHFSAKASRSHGPQCATLWPPESPLQTVGVESVDAIFLLTPARDERPFL